MMSTIVVKTLDKQTEKTREVSRKREEKRLNNSCTDGIQKTDKALALCQNCRQLQKDVKVIQLSLDNISKQLTCQQIVLARELEERVRHLYDDISKDINTVRGTVNLLGNEFAADKKYKTWKPLTPFPKQILNHASDRSCPPKLNYDKSVDFVNTKESGKQVSEVSRYVPVAERFKRSCDRSRILNGSAVPSDGGSKKVEGFGASFTGDGKTIPYRSYRMWYASQSCGPSRTGSKSGLDDATDSGDTSCMSGMVAGDWRVRVAPHMWDGWQMPGSDLTDLDKLKERIEKMANTRREIVEVHNEYRRLHGVPELKVDEHLAKEAQRWSGSLAQRGIAQYSNLQDRGENILVVDIKTEITGRQIVDTWYREKKLFNYTQPRWQKGTRNFTQMIWKSSKTIGVGLAKFPYHDTYVIVVQYQPPGNKNSPDQFRQNVLRPLVESERLHSNTSKAVDSLDRCEESLKTGLVLYSNVTQSQKIHTRKSQETFRKYKKMTNENLEQDNTHVLSKEDENEKMVFTEGDKTLRDTSNISQTGIISGTLIVYGGRKPPTSRNLEWVNQKKPEEGSTRRYLQGDLNVDPKEVTKETHSVTLSESESIETSEDTLVKEPKVKDINDNYDPQIDSVINVNSEPLKTPQGTIYGTLVCYGCPKTAFDHSKKYKGNLKQNVTFEQIQTSLQKVDNTTNKMNTEIISGRLIAYGGGIIDLRKNVATVKCGCDDVKNEIHRRKSEGSEILHKESSFEDQINVEGYVIPEDSNLEKRKKKVHFKFGRDEVIEGDDNDDGTRQIMTTGSISGDLVSTEESMKRGLPVMSSITGKCKDATENIPNKYSDVDKKNSVSEVAISMKSEGNCECKIICHSCKVCGKGKERKDVNSKDHTTKSKQTFTRPKENTSENLYANSIFKDTGKCKEQGRTEPNSRDIPKGEIQTQNEPCESQLQHTSEELVVTGTAESNEHVEFCKKEWSKKVVRDYIREQWLTENMNVESKECTRLPSGTLCKAKSTTEQNTSCIIGSDHNSPHAKTEELNKYINKLRTEIMSGKPLAYPGKNSTSSQCGEEFRKVKESKVQKGCRERMVISTQLEKQLSKKDDCCDYIQEQDVTILINKEQNVSKILNKPYCDVNGHSLTSDDSDCFAMPTVDDNSLEELLDILGEGYQHKSSKDIVLSKTVKVSPIYTHETVTDLLTEDE